VDEPLAPDDPAANGDDGSIPSAVPSTEPPSTDVGVATALTMVGSSSPVITAAGSFATTGGPLSATSHSAVVDVCWRQLGESDSAKQTVARGSEFSAPEPFSLDDGLLDSLATSDR
jgi:hypothetical protein